MQTLPRVSEYAPTTWVRGPLARIARRAGETWQHPSASRPGGRGPLARTAR
ncbi:MAG: hypothetical protein J7459_13940 [Chloroflexus sp.]|nr:hypothetical protein [Chloroflexus sp.]